MKVQSDKKNYRHEEYVKNKDNDNDEQNDNVEEQEYKELTLEKLMECKKPWNLNQFTDDLAFEELYEDEEELKRFLEEMKRYQRKRQEIYRRYRKLFNGKTNGFYEWKDDVYEKAVKNPDYELHKLKNRINDIII